jgi:hypothetical protein
LSYHRAGESRSHSGSPTVTVCTNHVARGDLVEDSLPFAIGKALGDAEVLVPEVVELQDERVALAAVNARPGAEQLDEVGGALRDQRPFSAYRVRDITLTMQRVMLPFVCGSARPAVVVALTARATAPGKVRDRQEPVPASTDSLRVGGGVRHERMFA